MTHTPSISPTPAAEESEMQEASTTPTTDAKPRMRPATQYRASVTRTVNGTFSLKLFSANGSSAAAEFATQDAAFASIQTLRNALDVQGLATDRVQGAA